MRLAILSVFIVTACGGTTSGGGGGQAAPGVLQGDPASSAAAALTDITPSPASPANVKNQILLDRLFAVVAKDATIGQLNAAAAAVGATAISFSAHGSRLITLRIPPAADPAQAKALAKTLRAQPGILFARPAREAHTSLLPVDSHGVPVPSSDLDHLLASRFPQAFNARPAGPARCEESAVDVYVFDKFGDSSLSSPGFFDQVDLFVPDPAGAGSLVDDPGHGYDVAMTLAAAFDDKLPTGANPFPGCVRVHQVEAFGHELSESMGHALELAKAEGAPRFAMNISLNSSTSLCGPASDQECTVTNLGTSDPDELQRDIQYRAILAGEWARLLSGGTLTPRMLLSVSAGNISLAPKGALERSYPGFRDATLSAPWTLATRLAEIESILSSATLWKSADPALPDLTPSAGLVTDTLVALGLNGAPAASTPKENLLIVGSTTKAATFQGLAASSFNLDNADLLAVGEGVPMPRGLFAAGTSFSAPQVAGLASYLWILSPGLRDQPAANTAALIKQTSHAIAAGPVIDAFAAVTSLPAADARAVRLAMLDANGDGNFDHLDLQIWIDKLHLNDASFEPATADFSQFDLNGDGASGGSPIAGLDLDLTSQTIVSELIEDAEVEMNEAALSDLQVLCFYAYSDLYAKAPPNHDEALAQRHLMLGPDRCVRAQVAANLVSVPPAGAPVTLTVTAGGRPARNLFLSLTGSCATVSPASGRTDSNGRFTTLFTPGNACATSQLSVIASGDEGSPVLATQQFTATVANGNIGAESFVNLGLSGIDRQTGEALFPSASLSATTTGSSGTPPPLNLTLTGSYRPDLSLPAANFSVSALSDGPIVIHSFAQPSSGTYSENAGCADTGQGIQDPNSESFLFPRPIALHASAEGAFEPDSPGAAGYTASLSFTMTRTEVVSGSTNGSEASLNGSVFIDFSLAGEPSQTLEFFLDDGLSLSGDPTGPVVTASRSFFIQKGGFVQAHFGMQVKCGTEFAPGDGHAIASKRSGSLTFSYSVQ